MKRLLLAIIIPLSVLVFSVNPAYAIALTFTPPGAQLDGDPILDIATNPGAIITFNVFFNPGATPGSAAAANPLTNITYGVIFDPAELMPAGAVFGGTFVTNNLVPAGLGSLRITHGGGGAIAPGPPAFLDGLDFRVLPGLVNDLNPLEDFEFGPGIITNALGGGFVDITQTVEVQPVPEPSSLLLFSIGLVGLLGFYSWRRQRADTAR